MRHRKTQKLLRPLLVLTALASILFGLMTAASAESSGTTYANFPREVSQQEMQLRMKYVDQAKTWLGAEEKDNSHAPIIDIYNSHEPLAVGYKVSYTDSWCSTFVSTVAIQTNLTEIIPTECGCDRHIALFQQLGAWVEQDDYVPLPGDLIFYTWKVVEGEADCQRASDHVGIVMGVAGNQILVIEGNNGDGVRTRCVTIDDPTIRGFATPDYSKLAG